MSEITRGAIGMPFEMAMKSELSRRQFHSIAQALLAERDQLKGENEALRKDAERYRWLRAADWWRSPLCAISNPKKQAKLGSDCPSGDRLDAQVDAAKGDGERP